MMILATTIFDTLIGSGGWAAAVAIVGYVGKNVLEGWLAKRKASKEDRQEELGEIGAQIGNATTVNAIMTKSIESLHSENVRLAARNEFLEKRSEDKDKQIAARDETIDRLKTQLEEVIGQAQKYVAEITTYQQLLAEQQDAVE